MSADARILVDALREIAEPSLTRADWKSRRAREALAVWRYHERTEARELLFGDALRAISTSGGSGHWLNVYRERGGGYEGLQAIAEHALARDSLLRASPDSPVEHREGMVTVYDSDGRYVGCMGIETWQGLLADEAANRQPTCKPNAGGQIVHEFAVAKDGERCFCGNVEWKSLTDA